MKKFTSLLIVILLIVSMAIPVSAANPTEYREKLSTEEMAALFGASKASYSYQVVGDDTVHKGSCTPLIRFFVSSSANNNNIFVYLPIPDLQGKMIYSFDVLFYLPINIKKCDTILTAVSPSAYCSSASSKVRYELSPNMEYQLDSTDNKVIYRRSFYGDGLNMGTYFNSLTNGYFCTSLYTPNVNCYYSATGTIDKPVIGTSNIAVLGLGQDVGTFGWSWKAGEYTTQSGTDSTTIGLGFIVRNFDITYELNGGYSPTPVEPTNPDPVDPDPTNPDPPVDPDPTDPTDPTNPDTPTDKGEYGEKLDEIYKALVASGQIQVQQNQEIIDGQKEINDKIDGITTPDEQTQQGVDDFSTQVDENDKKLDDIAEGMKIDVPDIETELDLSAIDEALTDDNFKSIMAVFWDNSRIISIFVVSFIVSIFGVIFRGKRA